MRAIVLSAMSDIGIELVKLLKKENYEVFGTYNSTNPDYDLISKSNWLKLDIKDYNTEEYRNWLNDINSWDLFISLIGTQEPVGRFEDISPDRWVEGVNNNSLYQIGALIQCLPYRNKKSMSNVIFFAGGGTNSATPYYSAYTLGKISLIKAVELLDSELENVKVTILGPGWVNTKIHNATLNAKEKAGQNYQKTISMLKSNDKLNPISKVIEDIHKLILLPKSLVGGRNFSSVYDLITRSNLHRLKKKNNDFYKLRRAENDS
tara:strand:- start:1817 stop:2605 length:789 start_codon:yes stop_codon:yes gene_type:complete